MPEPTAIIPDKGQRGTANSDVAALVKGTLVILDTTVGVPPFSVTIAGAVTDTVYGVAAQDIPGLNDLLPGSPGPHFGNTQIDGVAIVLAGAAVAAGVQVSANAAGRAILAAGAGTVTFGQTITAAAADGDLIEVELAGPGGGVTL